MQLSKTEMFNDTTSGIVDCRFLILDCKATMFLYTETGNHLRDIFILWYIPRDAWSAFGGHEYLFVDILQGK